MDKSSLCSLEFGCSLAGIFNHPYCVFVSPSVLFLNRIKSGFHVAAVATTLKQFVVTVIYFTA